MPLYVGDARVSRKNTFNRSSLCSLPKAWEQIKPLFQNPQLEDRAKVVLANWRGDTQDRRYPTWAALSTALKEELGRRENYFYLQEGENLNIETVIYKTDVPTSSIGWDQTKFFQELGHARNKNVLPEAYSSRQIAADMLDDFLKQSEIMMSACKQTLRRRAEQEYLMMNMVKSALWEAALVAERFEVGIAVRPTGLAAHMGIESGDPTKAQEFKNKTSKDLDYILCEEMEWSQIGCVVHYDPRVEWNSFQAEVFQTLGMTPMFLAAANEADWLKKRATLPVRFSKIGTRFAERNYSPPEYPKLKDCFMARSKEYMEEDHEYRVGHYAPYTDLKGPYVRLKLRPESNIVGDHDLFAFTDPDDYGVFLSDRDGRVARAQKALQNSPTFQAQHGGIWYWQPDPGNQFNAGIKAKIMGAHGPEGDEPLLYIRPHQEVTAAYYITKTDNLASVWSNSGWTSWMRKTHSGQLFLNPVPMDTE